MICNRNNAFGEQNSGLLEELMYPIDSLVNEGSWLFMSFELFPQSFSVLKSCRPKYILNQFLLSQNQVDTQNGVRHDVLHTCTMILSEHFQAHKTSGH